jgi:hypothetical protein
MIKHSRWLLAMAWLAAAAVAARAADKTDKSESGPAKPAAAAASSGPAGSQANLSATQQKLAGEFKDLQGVLMRMRDLVRPTDPNRAALIERALKESGDRRVEADFQEIVELLRQDQLGSAARKQGKINDDLEAILDLLRSEDRAKGLQKQKEQIRKFIERITGIIRQQQSVQGRTAGGDDPKPLSIEQGGLAQQTGRLSKDVQANQDKNRGNAKDDKGDGKSKPSEGKPSDKPSDKNSGKPDSKEPKPGKDGDKSDGKGDKDKAKPGDDAKSQGKPKSSQGKGQDKRKPSKGQGQEGQEGQESDQPPKPSQDQNAPQQDQDPIHKRLQDAQKHMEEAKDRLKKAQKDGAVEEQEKALEDLRTAKANLEEILRQLREEEMKRILTGLIVRMQKVLMIQIEIRDGTVRLEKVPAAERSHGHEIESGRLSARERSIVKDVEDALMVLREEGSAVAMPVALQQVHDDMQQIEQRLGQGKTEVLTQAIESDVIKELEEIIDAFKKAKERAENKDKKPGQSLNGQPQDPPLIEKLAELKMIRALQMRVNRRTERYSKLIEPGHEQTNKDDVFEALQRLAEQQKQVFKTTKDIELGKGE